MINEKHFNGIMMSLYSLHKAIAAKELEDQVMAKVGSNDVSDILISKIQRGI